jgi:predicted esterase
VDLATAYQRLDRAYVGATLPDSVRAAVNRTFDRATLSVFSGKFGPAIAAIDSATIALTGSPLTPPPAPFARVVNGRLPSMLQQTLRARLAAIDSTGPLAQALASVQARIGLLVDSVNPTRTIETLTDPAALAPELVHEVSALERGRDPYVGQAGDFWRVFRGAGGTRIPFRLIAPNAAATSSAPVPVIISLHGTAGDENMFIEAYGAGILRKLSLNALVVSPATVPFSTTPEHLDSLISVLRSEYRINMGRIYLLGHSLGAGVVTRLVQARPQLITAAACLAGGSAVRGDQVPPIMFLSGALDPIVPTKSVQAASTATAGSQFVLLPNEGHTLMVANAMRRAVPWLLDHRP